MNLHFDPADVPAVETCHRWADALNHLAELVESQPAMTVTQIFACIRRAIRITGWDVPDVQRALLESPADMGRDDALQMLRRSARLQVTWCEKRLIEGPMESEDHNG